MYPLKSIKRLLRGQSSKHDGDHYCMDCLHSFRTKKALKNHERLCDDHDYCKIIMPEEGKNTLKYHYGTKSLKMEHAMYLDLECTLIKHDTCANDPNNSYTEKIVTHIPRGYALSVTKENDGNKHKHYWGKDCLLHLCKNLRKYSKELALTSKKPLAHLTNEQIRNHERSKKCHICKTKFNTDENNKHYNNYRKVIDHDHYTGKYRGAAHSICNLRHETQREFLVIIHNGSKYDFHLIIKQLAKEFRTNMKCLGENTEKYISFSIPMKVENDEGKKILYKLKFIDRSVADSCRSYR